MAVTQISRIQQRRGKKNSGTGFPQLASGEIGWAIDTQELYIGNGSVSEGAPYVGNTKIITEHDNIFDLSGSYQYKADSSFIQTGPTTTNPIKRSLQERLDDYVSGAAFGIVPNGTDDVTAALQRAIDQLFLNDSSKANVTSRVVLYLEPGEYLISDTIRIPPYAHIVGAGIDSTIIKLTSGTVASVFQTVDGESTPGNYIAFESMSFLTRPRHIYIKNITLKTEVPYPVLMLDNTDSTYLEHVKFEGSYINGSSPADTQTGVLIRSVGPAFRCENVHFNSCIWNNTGYGVFGNSDQNYITFNNCTFYQLFDGINVGGGNNLGSIGTIVTDSYFDLIDRYGFYVKLGYGNTSNNNRYINVGNDNNGYSNATYPIISFETDYNQSLNDYFDRNNHLKDQQILGLTQFIPNIRSSSLITDQENYRKSLDETPLFPIEFLRFPADDSSIVLIDYVLDKSTNGGAIRTGTIHITVDRNANNCTLEDNFSYTGVVGVESIKFTASTVDINGDSVHDTLIVYLYNPSGNGIGTINYTYRYMVR